MKHSTTQYGKWIWLFSCMSSSLEMQTHLLLGNTIYDLLTHGLLANQIMSNGDADRESLPPSDKLTKKLSRSVLVIYVKTYL